MLEFIGLCALLLIAYKVLPDLVGFIVKIILGFIMIIVVLNIFVFVGQPLVFVN